MSPKQTLIRFIRRFPAAKRLIKNIYEVLGDLISDRISWPDDIELISGSKSEHLFGYYDKSPWNALGDIIYMGVQGADKFAASSKPADIILHSNNGEKRVVAQTSAWNVQQGSMLQWHAGSSEHILFNDFRNGEYCSVRKSVIDNKEQIFSAPVYSVSRDGKVALTLDFARLNTLRPGYGYSNSVDFSATVPCPDEPCIWQIDLTTNRIQPLYTYTELMALRSSPTMKDAFHKVNHIMISPSGNAFIFLHRWIQKGKKFDRLLWAPIDGSRSPRILLDEGMVSHSNWRDDNTIITYANALGLGPRYCLIDVISGAIEDLSDFFPSVDGHPSYSPDKRFVITDSYPDFKRKQSIFLLDMYGKKKIQLASIYASGKYRNNTRCDLHPRWSPNGDQICFDASKDGLRQVYAMGFDKRKV